ncbi:MAG: hypothetical protein ACREJG_12390 [Candidatus Rokuibacteriota bacterium]
MTTVSNVLEVGRISVQPRGHFTLRTFGTWRLASAILERVNADHLRAFARRGWHVPGASEEDHWARETAERGPLATFEVAHALWLHMRRVRPDWPTDEDRRADLTHHVALKRAIDCAAGAFLARSGR